MYLLDTNVLSEVRKAQRADLRVQHWFKTITPFEIFISAISIGEIRNGIESLRLRDPATAGRLETWLRGLESHYSERILPISIQIADRWGWLGQVRHNHPLDRLLAATCLEHRLTMVTRNVADFTGTGVPLFNPFAAA